MDFDQKVADERPERSIHLGLIYTPTVRDSETAWIAGQRVRAAIERALRFDGAA